MACNVLNVIQRGLCVSEHNNVKSAKNNATPDFHVFNLLLTCDYDHNEN